MITPNAEGFTEVAIRYPDWVTAEQRLGREQEERCVGYLGAIVMPPQVLRPMLADDFVHADGALVFVKGRPVVQNLLAPPQTEQGADAFVYGFRAATVNAQTMPNGVARGVWLPHDDYEGVEAQVRHQLEERGLAIRGELLGVAAVSFPYRLRPGGQALDLPPPFHRLLEPGEAAFTPHSATGPNGDAVQDHHDVNVLQAIYGDGSKITGRVGLVWDDPTGRGVPFAINHQLQARREQPPRVAQSPSPEEIAKRLHDSSIRPS